MRFSLQFALALIATTLAENEFDTYNAEECQRLRRPWHKLTEEEQELYVDGLLALRAKSNGDVDADELIAIGSVHQDESKNTHRTSSYFFWHGYILYELESRIRNLGDKWKCFAMPYWDFSREAGREYDPEILTTKALGGDGDPDNSYNVNGYTWGHTVEEYWVPQNCVAEGDEWPFCSLKRSLRKDLVMPNAKELGATIADNPAFVDFADYVMLSSAGIHLLDNNGRTIGDNWQGFPQAYEPIWYLYHSGIQYHQALWTDCHDYDLIPSDELDDHPDAFSTYCVPVALTHGTCDTTDLPEDSVWYGEKFGLDEAMPFGGSLAAHKWSYIHEHTLSVRELYHLPRWNIIYELGDEDDEGFYQISGLSDMCDGHVNPEWFVVDDESRLQPSVDEQKEDAVLAGAVTASYGVKDAITVDSAGAVISLVVLVPLIVVAWCYCGRRSGVRKTLLDGSMVGKAYGTTIPL